MLGLTRRRQRTRWEHVVSNREVVCCGLDEYGAWYSKHNDGVRSAAAIHSREESDRTNVLDRRRVGVQERVFRDGEWQSWTAPQSHMDICETCVRRRDSLESSRRDANGVLTRWGARDLLIQQVIKDITNAEEQGIITGSGAYGPRYGSSIAPYVAGKLRSYLDDVEYAAIRHLLSGTRKKMTDEETR